METRPLKIINLDCEDSVESLENIKSIKELSDHLQRLKKILDAQGPTANLFQKIENLCIFLAEGSNKTLSKEMLQNPTTYRDTVAELTKLSDKANTLLSKAFQCKVSQCIIDNKSYYLSEISDKDSKISSETARQITDAILCIQLDILTAANLQIAILRIERWITVMKKCFDDKNFESAYQLLGALNSTPIYNILKMHSDLIEGNVSFFSEKALTSFNEIKTYLSLSAKFWSYIEVNKVTDFVPLMLKIVKPADKDFPNTIKAFCKNEFFDNLLSKESMNAHLWVNLFEKNIIVFEKISNKVDYRLLNVLDEDLKLTTAQGQDTNVKGVVDKIIGARSKSFSEAQILNKKSYKEGLNNCRNLLTGRKLVEVNYQHPSKFFARSNSSITMALTISPVTSPTMNPGDK